MNKQSNDDINWAAVFGPGSGRTLNVVSGCFHGCRFSMGGQATQADCYAKTIADWQSSDKFYPQGFQHAYWHPERLKEPKRLKNRAGIFLSSMGDLFGQWVADEQIKQVLEMCADNPRHIFFVLTKNATRLKQYKFPDNVWVGASMPPTYMGGAKLDKRAQIKMLAQTLFALKGVQASVRWMSFEPLTFDVAKVVWHIQPLLDWAVIGALSRGKTCFQPQQEWVTGLLKTLDSQLTAVHFKNNLKWPADQWRADYPTRDDWNVSTQMSLL